MSRQTKSIAAKAAPPTDATKEINQVRNAKNTPKKAGPFGNPPTTQTAAQALAAQIADANQVKTGVEPPD